jgi:hypothetical protein
MLAYQVGSPEFTPQCCKKGGRNRKQKENIGGKL